LMGQELVLAAQFCFRLQSGISSGMHTFRVLRRRPKICVALLSHFRCGAARIYVNHLALPSIIQFTLSLQPRHQLRKPSPIPFAFRQLATAPRWPCQLSAHVYGKPKTFRTSLESPGWSWLAYINHSDPGNSWTRVPVSTATKPWISAPFSLHRTRRNRNRQPPSCLINPLAEMSSASGQAPRNSRHLRHNLPPHLRQAYPNT